MVVFVTSLGCDITSLVCGVTSLVFEFVSLVFGASSRGFVVVSLVSVVSLADVLMLFRYFSMPAKSLVSVSCDCK